MMRNNEPTPEEVFQQHSDYLFVQARCQLYRLGLNKIIETNEVLAECWLRFHKAWPTILVESNAERVKRFRVTVESIVLDLWRHMHRQKRDIRKEAQIEAVIQQSGVSVDNWLAASQTSPSRAASREEDIHRVSAALRKLADEIREVMICKFMVEMKRQEIADSLGITLNEVDYRTTQGLRLMRGFLE